MSLFNSILNDLVKKVGKKANLKEDIADILSKELNTKILADDLKIKDGSLFISTSPTIKSSILIKKDRLIRSLSSFDIKSIN